MRAALAALVLTCAAAPAAVAQERSIIIGKVESAKMLALLQDVMPPEPNSLWHGEVYELKLGVIEVLAGDDPGDKATVTVVAHAYRFVGTTVVVVIDPELELFVPGQSWWTSIRKIVCLPEDVVNGGAFADFVQDGFEWDDDRCVDLE